MDHGLDPADQGRVIETDGAAVLRFERTLEAPPARVWEALTSPDLTAQWGFRTEVEPRAGGAVTFTYGEDMGAEGEVLAWDEPRVLDYAWTFQDTRWRVRYELRPAGEGTSLVFDHLEPDPHMPDFAAGWHWHLDRLAQVLAGDEPARVDTDAHFDELQRFYAHAGG